MHRRERSEKLRCSSSHTANQMWADWCVCVCERESDSIVLTSRSFLTEKQVSRPSHVRLPAMPRMRRGIQVKRVIAAAAHTHTQIHTCTRARTHSQGQAAVAMATTQDAAEKALGGRESPRREEQGVAGRTREGCCHTARPRAAANHVAGASPRCIMQTYKSAAVFLIWKLRWNIYFRFSYSFTCRGGSIKASFWKRVKKKKVVCTSLLGSKSKREKKNSRSQKRMQNTQHHHCAHIILLVIHHIAPAGLSNKI